MGRSEVEADHFADLLEAEWLDDLTHLAALSDDDWQRLEIPAGLKAQLQRRLPACLSRAPAVRSSSAPPGDRVSGSPGYREAMNWSPYDDSSGNSWVLLGQ